MAKQPTAKLVDIFPCLGQESGVVIYQDEKGRQREIRLIKYKTGKKRLEALIRATGKPWDQLIEIKDHEEYGEYATVVGGVKGESALDALKALHKK